MTQRRLTFAEAITRVADQSPIGTTERIVVSVANDRVLSSPVLALRSYPAFDMAAMDGYAITLDDIGSDSERLLKIGKPHYAGASAGPMGAGEARWIATGAPVPVGTGAILIKEQAQLSDEGLHLTGQLPEGMNIRCAGEDAQAGESVLRAGERLHPAAIGALCAYGVAQVDVYRRPRVALVPLGDELAAALGAGPFSVIDANGPMVAATLRNAGCDVTHCLSVGDDPDEISNGLATLAKGGYDIIVTTGGASVGDRDYLRTAAERLKYEIHFHGVHVRPGKPVLFGSLPGGPLLFGLPGNPVAALVAARFFLCRALRAWFGAGAEIPRLCYEGDNQGGPTRILKVRAEREGDELVIETLPGQQSHILRPLLRANGWLMTGGGESQKLFPLYDSFLSPSF